MPMTEEHEQFRTMVRGYVEAKLNPRVAQWEADETIPLHQVFAEMADLGLRLLARTSDDGGYSGMSQILFPTETEGFSARKIPDKLGMRASDTGTLTFDDCRVPVENTIGEIGRGFQQQMAQFVVERMWSSYTTVGACDLALSRTREYCAERHVFGQPLLANEYLSFKLAELAARVDMLRVYNESLAEAADRGEDVTRHVAAAGGLDGYSA